MEIARIIDSIQAGSKAELCFNFLKDNYNLHFNVITGSIEDRNVIIDNRYKIISDREINTIFIRLSCISKDISKEFLSTFIFSEYVTMYNPFKSFIEEHQSTIRHESIITELAQTINTDTLNAEKYIKHWGCGMIASIFGSQSPLTLVLVGEKLNTGKTEWFRRLLPDGLKQYYDESSLDSGKDDDILMCKKLIIMDDEFGGKSKKDHKRFKGLTSRSKKDIRIPYGKTTIEMRRVCSLAGTSNELEILSDPYGNRRILPINVLSIDHEAYNKIDKTKLFMAFYDLYKSGFLWKFNADDIEQLNKSADQFVAINPESELINEYFELPLAESDGEFMTNTAIKDYIETWSKQKIFNQNKLGIELKKLGFIQYQKIVNRKNNRMYHVVKKKEPQRPNPFAVDPF